MGINRFVYIMFCLLLFGQHVNALAFTEVFEVSIDDQELSVLRYPAEGQHLVLWIAPGFGTHERAMKTSEVLAEMGIEIWHVDLADSLFLPKNTSTMRSLDGRYVAGLIEAAYAQTSKRITLLTRSYGALPLLRGVRYWQQQHLEDKADYLSGAILFSPELYSTVPALGLEPVYSDITFATNIPIMLYQAGKRSNRWQLFSLMENLRQGGAQVFYRVKHGVTGVFYRGDTAPVTLTLLKSLPAELQRDLKFLQKFSVPKNVAPLPGVSDGGSHGLDSELKAFKGNPVPHPLDLVTAKGQHIKRDDYKGKVTVVNFWATWCPPCVEEIPSLNNLRRAMQDVEFELISVNYAEDDKRVKDFLKQVNVDFPVLLDSDGRVSASWNVLVYPSTFVIGPDGIIHYGVNGAIHWDSPEVVRAMRAMLNK